MKQEQMIQPNRLEQATQELSNIKLGGYKIPKKILLKEKDYYVCVCVRSTENADRMSHTHVAQTRFVNINEWNRMERELNKEKPMFKMMFNDLFSKVVVLHNPNLVVEDSPNDEDVKPLSNIHKGKVNKWVEENGKPENEDSLALLVEEVGVEAARVIAHLETI